MLLSFIIATYQNKHSLPKAVMCLLQACDQRSIAYEIIVVDNSPTEEYIAPLQQMNRPEIKLLKNPKRGAHYSRLMGLGIATGKLIIVVDDDNYLTEQYIDFIIEKSKEDKQQFIGCANKEYQTVGWDKLGLPAGFYACGSREKDTFLDGIPVYWGAGSVLSRSLANTIFQTEMIVAGRRAEKGYIMSGEDHEISLRAYLLKATFTYYRGIGLYHDIDLSRLNHNYYNQLYTGLAYASWLLRPYYFLNRKSWLFSNRWIWMLFNQVCSIAYFIKYPFQHHSLLIIKDAFRIKEKMRQIRIVETYN